MSKKLCDLHGLVMRPKSGVTITSVLGKALDIMGTATIVVMLALILEVHLRDIIVSSGDVYQFLMEMNII